MADFGVADGSWRALGDRLAAVFQVIATPLAVVGTDLRYIAVNRAYEDVTERTTEELIGANIFDVFPENPATRRDDSPTSLRRSLNDVLRSGRPDVMPLIRYDVEHDGQYVERYWNVSNIPVLGADGRVEMILNHPEEVTSFIDERLRLQAGGDPTTGRAQSQSPSQANAVDAAFTTALSRVHGLHDLASSLVGASSPSEVGRAVMRDGLGLVGATGGSMFTVLGDRLTMVASTGLADGTEERWNSFAIEEDREPFSNAVVTGEPGFFGSRRSLLRRFDHLADALPDDQHAWAVMPLRDGRVVTGAIGMVFPEPQSFDASLRLALYSLANLVSQAASRAQLLAEQTTALVSFAAAFHPRLDAGHGMEITHRYAPATTSTAAGGDWYDVISITATTTLVVIGDVANHGARAAGEMGRARSTIHAFALQGHPPERICEEADAVLARLADTHSTCIVAVIDHARTTMTWTTAGHPYPIVRSADGQVELLAHTAGAPLGVGIGRYTSQQRRIEPGDTIVFYTDGLIESRAAASIDDGFETLQAALRVEGPSATTADRLYDELHPTHRHTDDIAILTVHFPDA